MTLVFDMVIGGTFGALLLWAVVSDLRRYRIPNAVSAGLLVLFAAVALTRDVALTAHLLAAAVAFAGGVAAYRAGMMGGGDVKFLAAAALWAGPAWASLALALSLATILFTVVTVGARMTVGKMVPGDSADAALPRLMQAGERLPMAVPIAIAVIWVVLRNPLGAGS